METVKTVGRMVSVFVLGLAALNPDNGTFFWSMFAIGGLITLACFWHDGIVAKREEYEARRKLLNSRALRR